MKEKERQRLRREKRRRVSRDDPLHHANKKPTACTEERAALSRKALEVRGAVSTRHGLLRLSTWFLHVAECIHAFSCYGIDTTRRYEGQTASPFDVFFARS
jgi:hypothetical protein